MAAVRSFQCWPYPNFSEAATTMFPRDFRYGYLGPISEGASGFIPLKPIEKDALRGDGAEEKVFDALSKSRQPMCVINGLKINSVLQPRLKKSFGDVEGEIDFVIIHWKIGVLLLEVKSKDNLNNYRKAMKQLDRYEKIIQELLSQTQDSVGNQVQDGLKVYKVYVAPNNDVTQSGKAVFNLDKNALGDIEKWFESNFCGREFDHSQSEVLRELCCLLVVSRTQFTIAKMHNCIDKQEFLKQSHVKQEKATDKLPKVVSTKKHPGLLTLKKQLGFLNEQQLAVWEGPRHQIIQGVAGSGKTLLLLYKALECAENGEHVKVIVSCNLVRMCEDFFKNSKNVTIVDWDDLIKGSEPDEPDGHIFVDESQSIFSHWRDFIKRSEPDCHIFVDESQLILSNFECVKVLNGMANEMKYCWFALDEMQVDADDKEKESLGKGNYKGSEYVETLHTGISTMIQKGFHNTVLDTCMRNTTKIHSFIQEYMKYSGTTLDDEYPTMKIGHNVSGEKVKVYVFETAINFLPQHTHHFPSANIDFIKDCKSEEERHDSCMEIVKDTITNNNNYNPSVIFVIGDSLSFKSHFRPFPLGIHTQQLFFDKSITALSHEWRTVFVICKSEEFTKNYVAMTRAMWKLVVMFV